MEGSSSLAPPVNGSILDPIQFPTLPKSLPKSTKNFVPLPKNGNFSHSLHVPPHHEIFAKNPNLPLTQPSIPASSSHATEDGPRPIKSFVDVLGVGNNQQDGVPIKPLGSYQGMPAIIFSKEEIAIMAAPFKLSLIGKFSFGRPSMESIRKFFTSLSLKGNWQVSLLDKRHVLIKLSLEEDYTRLWIRQSWSVQGFNMRVFKWSPQFRCNEESPVVPVWITLPYLPVHLVYCKSALFSIGKPLWVDHATATLNRPTVARVLVECDVSQPSFTQKV